jgi:Protein of unknown function (DUF2950)
MAHAPASVPGSHPIHESSRRVARIAYAAEYRKRGVITSIVSHDDTVYEKNLGKDSTAIGAKMSVFDPGAGWKPVAP